MALVKRSESFNKLLQTLSTFLGKDTAFRSLLIRLPALPVILWLLACYRSFPFAWHFRIFKPALWLVWERALVRSRILMNPHRWNSEMQKAIDDRSPIGLSPFDWLVTYKTWASPDDCDYRMHLSNSSYPKVVDELRFKAAISLHPAGFTTGGWIALAGTHHHFVREIPVFQPYEVRMGMAAWDQKWVYITCRFVSHPKKGSKNVHIPRSNTRTVDTVTTPSELSANNSPEGSPNPGGVPGADAATFRAIAEAQARIPEPDGATLHCVAVSVICFKIGRITVPPAVALALEGFCAPPPNVGQLVDGKRVQPYSKTNPPPHYVKHAKALRAVGNSRKLLPFLRGGWRDVPEGERWWDEALKPLDEQRLANLKALEGLRTAMEAVRYMI